VSVTISAVRTGSIAEKKRLRPGERLCAINGSEINDVLDYEFYAADARLALSLERPDGKRRTVRIRKGEYEDLGLEFESYLMDRQRSCRNDCIFCFVDQMPPGMRKTLYFKDDDDRLSFLFGNYVTLTNMSPQEIERLIKMRISPINVSVHTTNPELRCRMMQNRFAGESLAYLRRLAEAGIQLNCQLVLCPGVNDGEELARTLADLAGYYPAVQSIACVPVGLTKYREGLPAVEPYNAASAAAVIDQVEAFSQAFYGREGCRLAYASDEFYLKAGRPLPPEAYYGEFSQLENGVGMLTLFMAQFRGKLRDLPESGVCRRLTVATGTDARQFLQILVDELQKKWHNLKCEVLAVENDFFGRSITVAGLVTGRDLIAALSGRELGEALLVPASMLRHEQDKFLDDVTPEDVENALGVPLLVCEPTGEAFLEALTAPKLPC